MADLSLAQFLDRSGISCAEFARRLGVTDSAVWRWANGRRSPSLGLAFAIERETHGAVPARSWRKSARLPSRKPENHSS